MFPGLFLSSNKVLRSSSHGGVHGCTLFFLNYSVSFYGAGMRTFIQPLDSPRIQHRCFHCYKQDAVNDCDFASLCTYVLKYFS